MKAKLGLLGLVGALAMEACSSDLGRLSPRDGGVELEPGDTIHEPPGIAADPDAGAPPPGVFGAPTNLLAFPGGASVAIRWTSPATAEQLKQHDIYRNGSKVGAVTPGFHPEFPEKNGNGYIDRTVSPGLTYEYSVRAIAPDGATSEASAPVSVRTPETLLPAPQITIDTSMAPDLATWATDTVKPLLEIWYPKLAYAIAWPDYSPPTAFSIKLDPAYTGVAAVGGTVMFVNPAYARKNPLDLGLFIHESAHVVQQAKLVPSWAIEGVADWTREYVVHDRDPTPVGPGQSYLDGYSTASFFLSWIQETYAKPTLLRSLTVAGNAQTYTDAFFVDQTGKSVTALWNQLTGQTMRGPGPIAFSGMANKCLAGPGGPVSIATCNAGASAQAWTVIALSDGTAWLRTGTGCLDVKESGTENGAAVQTFRCNGTGAQVWRQQPDGTLINGASGRCLDNPNASTIDGTALRLHDCSASAGQKLTLP